MKKLNSNLIHGTCVSLNKKGILIIGKSSLGKSSLGLDLIFMGGKLISDDITKIDKKNNDLIGTIPEKLPEGIEVRNFGILKVPSVRRSVIDFVVDLSEEEKKRIPENNFISILGIKKPYYMCKNLRNLHKIIFLLTKYGKIDIEEL